eukprot:CAMPEP_0170814800 /NCGR_PEP_ID=MMETSP0733-20121128/37956_1 /TAXON_ID=186038 /ORGANISM="Fragilariopsis kerguelensis, Strain L26-C5" /LENGTH=156 /DNA_ID=CAMNT_0011172991 /DNA_START=98 /DNA_END=568 /DNA_ORIENTATION=+
MTAVALASWCYSVLPATNLWWYSHNNNNVWNNSNKRSNSCPGYFHVTSDSGGPPLSMERKHQSEITYPSIDVYETKTTLTKSRSELKVPSMERDELLRRYGYSLAERQQATKQSTITRNQRKKSNRGADGSSASFLGLHYKSFKNKMKKNKIGANN